jgi:DNA-binding MarR family transcriptional regulator
MPESTVYKLHKLVFALDRVADTKLQETFGISLKRALFLVVLHREGEMIQHQLAVALGYTDPAVSSMLTELVKQGYVDIETNPQHRRKRMVNLTKEGNKLITRVKTYLDEQFTQLIYTAGVDEQSYNRQTEQLYQALTEKGKKDE